MLSPALLRVCCLAVMAPALTKAVRQADGLTLLILPQKIPSVAPCKTQRADNSDRLSAESLAGEWKGDSVTRHSTTLGSNGSSWQISAYSGVKLQENESRHPTNDSTDAGLSNSNVLKHAKSEWCRIVGVLTPTAENSDLEGTMNEDISETPERMGLLNANTSLDCDFRSKIDFSRQCASPICADMSAKEQEVLDDISTKCPIGALLSPPGSPKSVSGESTSTVTAHNPSVVTFVELEDAKNIYQKNSRRCAKVFARLKNLEVGQVEHLTGVQLMSFTSHYQNVFSIPCQRPMKHSSLRRSKDSIDLKAEFLQNEDVRNLSTAALVNLVRKYESSNSSGKLHQSNKALASQLDEVIPNNRVTSQLSPDECKKIKHVVGTLTTRIKHLAEVDSDATESSSGGESCDELEGYEDKKLHSIPIHKRALWTWVTGRSPIAKRWTWLQSQVSDLEYRVRQIADLLTQARAAKSSLCFEENHPREPSGLDTVSLKKTLRSVNGYLDHTSVINSNGYHSVQSVPPPTELLLDGSFEKNSALYSSGDDCCTSVSRTRPIKPDVFRKRKLLRTMGLHLVSRKAARLSSVRCTCNSQSDVMPCILCSGRYNNTQSVDTSVMPLLERVALLQPTFHPLLSFEKDIPLTLHFENHLKKSETYYHVPKPGPSFVKKPHLGMKPRSLADQARNHSRKLTKHAAQTLLSSARYRNSRHARSSSSKLRNRNITFKKWRNFQSSSFKTKDRVRRWSAASSCSSRQESPVHSPAAFEDGRENYFQDIKRRRDGNQYDIDNIVIPYNLKTASSFQKLKYKEIITPKWRVLEEENLTNGPVDFDFKEVEDISDETRLKLHDRLEIEERKQVRGGSSHASMARRGRRNFRYDSSGANTPDHLPYYHQDIMFQDSNSFVSADPASPAISPPATPSSMNAMSDDSQPSMSALPASCSERRRTISFTKRDRSTEDTSRVVQVQEYVEHQPFEKRQFPLSEMEWEEILKEPTLIPEAILPEMEEEEPVREDDPVSSPGSPETSSSTSSALEDVTDPEWTVVRRQNGQDRTLVLKLAKR